MLHKYSEKTDLQRNKKKGKRNKHVRLSGHMYIEQRRMIERRAAASFGESKKKKKKQTNKLSTRERRHVICKPNARRIQFRAICG